MRLTASAHGLPVWQDPRRSECVRTLVNATLQAAAGVIGVELFPLPDMAIRLELEALSGLQGLLAAGPRGDKTPANAP